jgi:hypothetical protein
VAALIAVFLTFGVPRWLAGDVAPDDSSGDVRFAKVCRGHGGTLTAQPGSRAKTATRRLCTVRYGGHVYVMDAITPGGFDEDTARFQRQGCDEARRQQRASAGPGAQRRSFVYHPATGVCEHRP